MMIDVSDMEPISQHFAEQKIAAAKNRPNRTAGNKGFANWRPMQKNNTEAVRQKQA